AFGSWRPRASRTFLFFLWGSTFFLLIRWLPYGLTRSSSIALLLLAVGMALLLTTLRWLGHKPIGLGWRVAAASLLIALALVGLDGLRGRIRADLLRTEFTNHDLTRY